MNKIIFVLMDILEILAANVIELRKARGLTQKQFAEVTGIAQSQISRIEKHSLYIGLTTLVKLSEALNVPPHLLLKHPEEKNTIGEQIDLLSKKEREAVAGIIQVILKAKE